MSRGGWYGWDGEDLLLKLRVQARASRDELGESFGDELKVRITAPPVEGKANQHLVRFMAESFGVPIDRVTLLAGGRSRSKRLRIAAPSRLPDGIARP